MSLLTPRAPGKKCLSVLSESLPLMLARPKRDAQGEPLLKKKPGAPAKKKKVLEDPDFVMEVAVESEIPDEVEATFPLSVYTVPVKKLASGSFLDAAKSSGWKFFILDGGVLLGAATFARRGGKTQFAAFEESPTAQLMLDAVNRAEASRTVKKAQGGRYKPLCLEIPSLHFSALWLHRAEDDLIIPFSPSPGAPLKPETVHKRLVARLKKGRALIDPAAE